MSAHQALFPVTLMARVLGVSESGFHVWHQRQPSAQAIADAALLKQIRTIHASSRETYGAPRVHAELRAGGEKHGRKRIARLMRAAGLVGASRRGGTVVTTRRDREARPAPDLVDRNFVASRSNQLWVADITFVPTASGFLYLAVVLDAWSRRIVGWSMTNHLRAALVLDALEMAIGQRRPDGVIHHSDPGSQYTSLAFGNRCKEAGVRPSMGSVGDAYDNLWTPPAARRFLTTNLALGAQIYPACCWSDRAPGHDGIRDLPPHNAIGLEGRVVGQVRKLRSTPCRHHLSSRTYRRLRDDLDCIRQARA